MLFVEPHLKSTQKPKTVYSVTHCTCVVAPVLFTETSSHRNQACVYFPCQESFPFLSLLLVFLINAINIQHLYFCSAQIQILPAPLILAKLLLVIFSGTCCKQKSAKVPCSASHSRTLHTPKCEFLALPKCTGSHA